MRKNIPRLVQSYLHSSSNRNVSVLCLMNVSVLCFIGSVGRSALETNEFVGNGNTSKLQYA